MKISADINKVEIVNGKALSGEFNVRDIELELAEELTACQNCFLVVVLKNGTSIDCPIEGGEVEFPCILKPQNLKIGVYAYDMDDSGKITKCYSPEPCNFFVDLGSYKEGGNSPHVPSPEEYTKLKMLMAKAEQTSNKVTEITEESTDEQYPTAKAVYDLFENAAASGGNSGSGVSAAQKQTLLAVINAIGLFNTENAQKLLDDFNKAWDTVDPVPATSIALDKTELTFTTEDTQTLTATVLPSNTTDVVAWTSSNTSIATVKGGVVTPLNDGEAVITAIAGNVSATCAVTVNMFGEIENPVFVSSGTISISGTATSEPASNSNYPNSVTFSAIPVKSGTILTCKTNIVKPQDWVFFYEFDTDGLNGKRIYFADTTAGTTNATRDGFIRVVIMRNSQAQFSTGDVLELSTTTNGKKTTYTLVDRR